MRNLQVALIGDYDPVVTAHQAVPLALLLAAKQASIGVHFQWVHTTQLTKDGSLSGADALWCVPATPYANTFGVLEAIRGARLAGTPLLGTCGGFQHLLLEAAGSLWGLATPSHAELDPGALDPIIAPLACSLVEVSGTVRFASGSRVAAAYDALEAEEQYHCRYGLSPQHTFRLATGPLRATAWDDAGEVRAVELDRHPFFVGTLFQPERSALTGRAPPLVRAFVQAIAAQVG